ncbi:MAG: GNAT family N-acetyltransferase [Clostridium sp.]|nr:GNAT family N-acetyltransferase [Clostridium sp.]
MVNLVKSNVYEFQSVYQDMLEQFPESELNEFLVYERLLKSNSYELYLVADENKCVGYVMIYRSEDKRIVWLDYIAVFKQFHSNGYGRKIIKQLLLTFKGYNGIFLEVEKPDENNPNTIRRINFYKNLGAKKLDCIYFYPNKNGCVPLDLYFIPTGEGYIFPSKKETHCVIKDVFSTIHSHHRHLNDVLKKIII